MTNKSGRLTLDHPAEAVGVPGANSILGNPFQSDPAELRKDFGAALAA